MITVEDAADISAFVNYTPPLLKDEGSTTKSCIMESAGSPTAAAADAGAPVAVPNMAPAVVVAPPPPTVAVAVTLPSSTPLEGGLVFSTAWGVSVDSSSPLAHTLAKEQRDYIAAYGVTGQSPIQ